MRQKLWTCLNQLMVAVLCLMCMAGCGKGPTQETKAPPPTAKAPAEEIIIDNRDADFTIVSGNWGTADRTNGNGSYGEDFRYLAADRSAVGRARFIPKVSSKRIYEVCIYWSADPDRTTKQPVIVHDADGKDHAYSVNLQTEGNHWFRLGDHVFAPDGCYIEFNNDTDNGYCNADAVKFKSKE
ncbi:MAG: hypothetical protein AB1696_06820 [Planctomycetota bacterium]